LKRAELKKQIINTVTKILLGMVCVLVIPGTLVFSQDSMQPLSVFNNDKVRVIEGASYCSAGFGTQSIEFKFEGDSYQSEEVSEIHAPGVNILNSPFLRIGCSLQNIIIDYSFYEDSVRFDETLVYEGTTYNSIEFRVNTIRLGYAFSLVPHRLHLDMGLGYSQFQYKLGYYDDDTSTDYYKSEQLNESGLNYSVDLKLFLSVYIYLNWLNQRSASDNMPVSYTNQLGLNFLVKL
jgi:hypothetical protein